MSLFASRRTLIMLLAAVLFTACASAAAGPNTARVIFVTSNGWHTGISLARSQIPPGHIPEAADFPDARFIEFGWGDAVYYPAKETTIGMTLGAALVPTPAVMHVAGLWTEPARYFQEAETVALPISRENFSRLVAFIGASFERSGEARAATSGPGLYASSRFYPARGSFHLFNTCNTWTARALAAAGFAVEASGTTRAEGVMSQIRPLARRR